DGLAVDGRHDGAGYRAVRIPSPAGDGQGGRAAGPAEGVEGAERAEGERDRRARGGRVARAVERVEADGAHHVVTRSGHGVGAAGQGEVGAELDVAHRHADVVLALGQRVRGREAVLAARTRVALADVGTVRPGGELMHRLVDPDGDRRGGRGRVRIEAPAGH